MINHEKITQIYKSLQLPAPQRSEEDSALIKQWITSFQLFQAFEDSPELNRIISFIEPLKIKGGDIVSHQEGLQFLFVVSGSVIVDQQYQNYDTAKKRSKKEGTTSMQWVVRPAPTKNCYTIGKQAMSEVLVVNSKKAKKLINKRLTYQWGQFARTIQRQPLFKYLDKDTLLDIAQSAKIMNHYYNSTIYSKGQQAIYSYILLQGSIKIFSDNVQVTCLSPQQVFGDQEILSRKIYRQFKAVCASEKVKLMRIEKSEVQKTLAVLTVLGKQKSLERYVNSKNDYRKAISIKMKRLLQKDRDLQFKQIQKQTLPLYRHKRNSLDEYSFGDHEDLEAKFLSSRWMQTLKMAQTGRPVIRSRDVSKSPPRETFYGRKSLDPRLTLRMTGMVKFPHLTKS